MNSLTPSVRRDLRQEVTDSIIAALEKGVAPWQKPWQSGAFQMPFNPTSGKSYRGGNAIHLMVVCMRTAYEDPRWLTYRQAQENGWQVRRGEKGTQIEFCGISRTGAAEPAIRFDPVRRPSARRLAPNNSTRSASFPLPHERPLGQGAPDFRLSSSHGACRTRRYFPLQPKRRGRQ